ncbi:hypothetical protein ACIOHC_11320 [Streptomyces sp. NPDC088252]|uniref:hypothetical protein n=1 Tax=unclassified Streptomyces TaxID=2593676 RepID=UPI0038034D9A
MIPIPPAAVVVMLAGADDYRTTTPPEQQTLAGMLDRIEEFLLSFDYTIRPDPNETT